MAGEGEGEMTEAGAAVADEDMACDAAAEGNVDVEVAVLVAAALTAFVIGVPVGFAAPAAGALEGVEVAAAPAATGDGFAVGSGWPMGVS